MLKSLNQKTFTLAGRRQFSATSFILAQNLTEKLVQKYAVELPANSEIHSGDYVSVSPYHVMTHDNSWPVALKFKGLGATEIKNKDQVVLTIDHDVQNKTESNLKKYSNIAKFSEEHGLQKKTYKAGDGIGHQIMIENGYAFPNTLAVASDSHSNTYGGIGCLGTPVVRTDAACIWSTGQFWWQIPPVAKVELIGKLPIGLSGKDIIVSLCGIFNNDEVLNHCIEFTGTEETLSSIPIDSRLTIANMTTEWGALSGVFAVDETLKNWYKEKYLDTKHPFSRRSDLYQELMNKESLKPDSDAQYAKTLKLDLSKLTHYIAGPNSVKISQPVSNLFDMKINKAYLVSCTNSRLSDLEAAAKVFTTHGPNTKIADGVQMYIAAASKTIQKQAEENGTWKVLIDAGCTPLPSGCGPCIGLGTGLLEPGEVGVSATNRNFKGRMGSKEAKAFLASPAVVAASAIKGFMAVPNDVKIDTDPTGIIQIEETKVTDSSNAPSAAVEMLPEFPKEIRGELVFCDQDNINTDGIYPGKYTYEDYVSKEKMAEVCMENYDAKFQTLVKPGDIIVSGFNFGTGSSREQAATAILAKGVPLVVAGSFSNIFFRNSINNALLTLELPSLIKLLRENFSNDESKVLTKRTGYHINWNIEKSIVSVTNDQGKVVLTNKVGSLSRNLQEIIVKGGLEGWVKSKL
ncbi:hypothetical protein QEN19_001806 [Hanseniaspora menglaensis]